GAAAEVEGAAVNPVDVLQRGDVGVYRITDVEDVAHLPAVTVNGDWFVLERADQEVGDPALVLGAHLPLPVDAAHPEYCRRDAETARIIEHVLVGGAFRAAIRRVEVERPA